MDTHYYNAFHTKDKNLLIESKGLTKDEAIEDIIDYDLSLYAYTLEVSSKEAKRIDLEIEALEAKWGAKVEHDNLVEQELA